jgi:hypothetical protein
MAATEPYVINGTANPDVISVSYDPPAMPQGKLVPAITRGQGGNTTDHTKAYITVNGQRKVVQIPQTQAIIINGLDGDDLIEFSGNHTVEIHAGAGNDRVFGGPRNDLILGDAGHDVINAGLGNDTVHGGADGDEVHGNGDDDVLYADGGGDALFGEAGADKLYGGADNDNIHGGDGPDIIMAVGGGSGDVAWGESGFDSFWVDDKPTEIIGDANLSEMAINLHRVGNFEWPKLPVLTTQVLTRSVVKRGFGGLGGLGGKLGGLFDNFPDPVAPGYTYKSFASNPLFGNGGPMPQDIHQGQVGDCYFLAGLSAVAKVSPNYITQSVAEMGDGTFAIRMWDINHKAHFLRVDADLPVNSAGNLGYAGLGVGNTIWAPILEKAYAFFRKGEGTYASISGGWPEHTYRALGMRTTVLASTTYNTPEKMIQAIRDLWANGNAVSFVTKQNAPVLVGLHVYMVDRIVTDAAGITSVVLRNPWGIDGGTVGNEQDSNPNDGYVTVRADQLFTAYDQVAGGRM